MAWLCLLMLAVTPPPAFPGAQGFGASSRGGRGGDVYHVTTLDNAGPGSLRDAIEHGPRPLTVVFDVGGTITLSSTLAITRGGITLAGQTAPGDGITLTGYPTIVANCEDVIIRYMRFRTGDANAADQPTRLFGLQGGKPGQGNRDLAGDAADALAVVNSTRVMIDHVTATWGMDETLSVTHSNFVTVQNSIIAWSLNDSFHAEGPHGYGSLVRGRVDDDTPGGYTFANNLWAHHLRRSPGFGAAEHHEPFKFLELDLVNNVVYDWGMLGMHSTASRSLFRINLEGNMFIAGPDTPPHALPFLISRLDTNGGQVFAQGNKVDLDRDADHDPRAMTNVDRAGSVTHVSERFDFPGVAVSPAEDAYQHVLMSAGASLVRDSLDERLIDEVRSRTGGLIDAPDPLPPLSSGDVPLDSDRDGMPDDWERAHGLNPDDAADRNAISADEYTQLEIYLHHLVAR
jgi:hypothetical protein